MREATRRSLAAAALGAAVVAGYYLSGIFERPLEPLTGATADAVAGSLRLLDIDVIQDRTRIYRPHAFGYEIYYRCTGFLPVVAFAIAVLSYPSRPGHRLRGLAIGIPLILLVNLARLIHLFLIGIHEPRHFWLVHSVVWHALVAGWVLLLWLAWIRRGQTTQAASRGGALNPAAKRRSKPHIAPNLAQAP